MNGINKVEGNTLYHFMSKADGDGNRLEDARFFYNLTVSVETDCVEECCMICLQRSLSNSLSCSSTYRKTVKKMFT